MRSFLALTAAAAIFAASPALSDQADPTSGPWWTAPEVFLSYQTDDGDEARSGGFLLPFVHLERRGTRYDLSITSRRVLPGETRELPDCSLTGTATPAAAGSVSGHLDRLGGVEIRDLGGGIVAIAFEREADCGRNGRYLATWTAPH
jgi:hypothetical protein